MKKIPIFLIGIPLVTLFVILNSRYNKNITAIAPFPYQFTTSTNPEEPTYAPVLIIGDRMATRLASFKEELSEKISTGLSKPIEVTSLSLEGMGSHRVLNHLKNLKKMPLVIIYLQSIDEGYEKIFLTKSILNINNNFKLYQNDYLKSLLMVVPEVSKFLYTPVPYIKLPDEVILDKTKYTQSDKQKREILNFKLYDAHIEEIFNIVKKRSARMIALTSPLNVKKAPNTSCQGSINEVSLSSLSDLKDLIAQKDYKAAFNISKDLALVNSSNAEILYSHALVLEKLNKITESKVFYNKARAYDCKNTIGHPVYNAILKKNAKKSKIDSFDFHQFLLDQSYRNYVFLDDTYPQDFYFQKLTDILALKIKKLLGL